MTTLSWHSEDPAVHAAHDVERGVYLMVDCAYLPGDRLGRIVSVRRGDDALAPAVVTATVYADDLELAKRVAEAVAGVVAASGGGR